LFIVLASLACGFSSAGAPTPTLPPTSTATVPQFGHLVLQYFANTHPSIGNYFILTTGQIGKQ
jgi:hypothetical protein